MPALIVAGRPRLPPRPSRNGPWTGDPGTAFFCSNRRSHVGCGRTFPVYWQAVIPYCSLRTIQLLDLLRLAATAATCHAAWQASGLALSLRSACRWLARWQGLTTHVRTRLHMIAEPPGKAGGPPDPFSLRHLEAAFRNAACPIAAFQLHFQRAVTG